jgi:hypothetical protein
MKNKNKNKNKNRTALFVLERKKGSINKYFRNGINPPTSYRCKYLIKKPPFKWLAEVQLGPSLSDIRSTRR